MQTTIRVDKDTAKMLEIIKNLDNANSYDEVIKSLIEKRKISMFGADKDLIEWSEKDDRIKFRTDNDR